VKIENEQVLGTTVKSPGPTRNVGGWAMMFLMFSLSSSAASLFEEKKAGLFLRLLAAPVRRTHILWSKYLCGTLIGLAQILILFCAGSLMYGIEVLPHLPALLAVSASAAAACTAFGMLLAAVARSQATAQGMATFLILTMSAIGGAWFPISLMPEFLQAVAKLTIVYWSVEGFLRVLWQGQGVFEVLPIVGILLGIAVAINAVSAWRFRTGTMFR
jgi:ABC-2 type transport system permease protein